MDYLSVTEFARLHDMDRGNINRLISQGRIPAIKIGNQWAIPADTPNVNKHQQPKKQKM